MSRLCLRAAFDSRLLRRSFLSPRFLRSALSRHRVARTSLCLLALLAVALAPAQLGDADAPAGATANTHTSAATIPSLRMHSASSFRGGSVDPEAEPQRMSESFGAARAGERGQMPPAAILDIDGTLVDTNYQHALAWYRAFRQSGIVLPVWRIHRHIGMGGDQLVAALAGDEVEDEHGDDIRAAEGPLYLAQIEEVEPMEGARQLIVDLKEKGHTVVLASSAKQEEIDHYLDLLDARELADAWTSSADVEKTKPEPDLVQAAIDKAGGGDAVMIGDSVWDVEAAGNAGIKTIGVLTGGFCADELEDAGAAAVFRSLPELREGLDSTPLA